MSKSLSIVSECPLEFIISCRDWHLIRNYSYACYNKALYITIYFILGQSIKDVLCWPRPGPPVVRLQSKWSLEYGMPSTHAMVGVSIPFSVVIYTMHRYEYNVPMGFSVAVVWCALICVSRIYLGMHTVLVRLFILVINLI